MHKSVLDVDDYYRSTILMNKNGFTGKLSCLVDMSDFGQFFLSEKLEVSAGRIKAQIFILL